MWLSQPLSRHYHQPALKGDSSRARPVGDAARGESGGIGSIASSSEARRPYSNQRCGCEQSEQTEGLHRGCCYLRQPLSLAYGSPAPRKGEPFGLSLYCTKRRPRKRGSCRRKPTEGEHLVPFCISEPFPFRHGFRRDTNAGWNMVVLLRCRLQYSLFRPILPSLHRPLGALGSNPPQAGTAFGLELVLHPKAPSKRELEIRCERIF